MKLILRGAYRLSGTGIVECLEIVDVGCNLNSLMAWPDWPWLPPPYFTTECTPLAEVKSRYLYLIVVGHATKTNAVCCVTWHMSSLCQHVMTSDDIVSSVTEDT